MLCLNPQELRDVWRDILWVGEATKRTARAEQIVGMIGERIGELEIMVDAIESRPRVVLLEWLQPFYVGGHWVPEMIERAGGIDVMGKAEAPSFRVREEEIIEAAPDVLIVAPCGYSKERSREEYLSLTFSPEWATIPAVRNGRVYAMDANSYVSRPGPRLVTGMEAMAKAIHPYIRVRPGAEAAVLPIRPRHAQRANRHCLETSFRLPVLITLTVAQGWLPIPSQEGLVFVSRQSSRVRGIRIPSCPAL